MRTSQTDNGGQGTNESRCGDKLSSPASVEHHQSDAPRRSSVFSPNPLLPDCEGSDDEGPMSVKLRQPESTPDSEYGDDEAIFGRKRRASAPHGER